MHVVIVDEELPYPPNSGKRIRTLNLIIPLAERHRILYLCHPSADAEETIRAVAFFRQRGIETLLVNRTLPRKSGAAFYGRLLWNLCSPLPYPVQIHNSSAMQTAIRQYEVTHRVDLWQCECSFYAESVGRAVHAPWIVMAHNVESLIWRRYTDNESNPLKRWYIKRQWRKFERFERRIFSVAPLTIAVSDNDARLMRQQYCAARVDVVDNGVDANYFQPSGTVRDRTRLLFLGSLDWRPNLDAVEMLLDRVFPQVLAQEPLARLAIVGRKPPRHLVERIRTSPGVELHADVPDVRPFLHECGLMVVPLRIGGGSRLKIIEAAAVELPVVSTQIGAEGLAFAPGEHFLQVESIEQMADAVLGCIRNQDSSAAMAKKARRVVEERYDWNGLANQLDQVWRGCIASSSPCSELELQ